MATLVIRANKSSAFLQRESDGLNVGAGQDDHMPVASSWAGHKERSACGFSIPSSVWADMGSVEQVQLVLRSTGAGVHVGRGSSPKCTVRRITQTWSPNGATMDGGGSATNAGLVYPGPSSTSTDSKDVTYPGSGGDQDVTVAITQIARAWMPTRLGGTGGACNGVLLVQTSNAADISEFYSAEVSTDSWRPSLVITYTPLGSSVPASPSLISPAGLLVPAASFHMTFGQAITAYDIDVSTDKTFATITHWNLNVSSTGISGDGKSVTVPYAGAPLAYATPTYWWRARGKNAAGDGAYAEPVSFTLDASGSQGDQLDQWADHVLADLATPRRHTMLGTIVPVAGEVAQLAATDYQGRWYLQDANHGTPISRVVELVGMTLRADATNGWSVDATTHDLGGAELLPPDYVPLQEDRDAAQELG